MHSRMKFSGLVLICIVLCLSYYNLLDHTSPRVPLYSKYEHKGVASSQTELPRLKPDNVGAYEPLPNTSTLVKGKWVHTSMLMLWQKNAEL